MKRPFEVFMLTLSALALSGSCVSAPRPNTPAPTLAAWPSVAMAPGMLAIEKPFRSFQQYEVPLDVASIDASSIGEMTDEMQNVVDWYVDAMAGLGWTLEGTADDAGAGGSFIKQTIWYSADSRASVIVTGPFESKKAPSKFVARVMVSVCPPSPASWCRSSR